MIDIEIYNDIVDLFLTYNIGNVMEEPVCITGGLMHKMFKVSTETKVYALKWLNPSIMQRSGVMENMINSERIANAFSNYLPVVAALNFGDRNVLTLNDNYYMIFDWMEGTSIFPPVISVDNCYEIGKALGIIHQLNLKLPGIKTEKFDSVNYNWQQYLEKGMEQNAPWTETYSSKLDELILWTKRTGDAIQSLAENRVISHRDLDPKNVLWHQDKPYLIDWEAAGYVNPYQELLEVLNYWSNNGDGELDKGKFDSLLNAYRNYMSTKLVNWDIVLDSGYAGMLGWLEYSLKRALGMESMDEQERKLGAEQIMGTITELENYDRKLVTIKKWLCE